MADKTGFIKHYLRRYNVQEMPTARLQELVRELADIVKLRVTLVDLEGTVMADSSVDNVGAMESHRYRGEVIAALRSGTGESEHVSQSLASPMLYYARKTPNYIVRLSKPLNEIDEGLAHLRNAIAISSLVVFAATLTIIMIISRIITRPVREAMQFADAFARGDFSLRILNYADDEIGMLQVSLNRLAESLQEKIEELVREQNMFRLIIENIYDGLALIGNDRRLITVNRAFAALFAIDGDVAGRPYYEVIRGRELNERIGESLGVAGMRSFEAELPGGLVCEINLADIELERSSRALLVAIHDITARKRMMELKTELVGNLSHELKTPIAIIKGYLETIRDHRNSDEIFNQSIEGALANADRQAAIITDMLKLNRLETTADFPRESIDIAAVLDTCVRLLSPKSEELGVAMAIVAAPREPVQGNRFLAEEIFFNLIDNALNYNRQGGSVTIDAGLRGEFVTVMVRDTGVGISPILRERIFERFYRIDKSRSRATGGTGLGLAIVKHALQLLGWQIEVAGDGGGTTFTVLIPDIRG